VLGAPISLCSEAHELISRVDPLYIYIVGLHALKTCKLNINKHELNTMKEDLKLSTKKDIFFA
jgi:hypothetical protein